MKVRRLFIWIGYVLGLMLLAACGSSGGSGGDQSAGETGTFGINSDSVQLVGAATCIGCHEDFSWSAEEVDNYLAGKHVIHSDHIDAAADASCLECHDSIGDGFTLEEMLDPAHVPAAGLAAVTCEDCHGAGGEHFGVGPMPVAQPDVEACTKCHNDEIPESHAAYHPEAMNIAAEFAASPHAKSLGDNDEWYFVEGSTTDVRARCAKCHSDRGAKIYRDTDAGYDDLSHLLLPDGTPAVENDTPIQCRTCHDAHNPSKLLEAATETASAEYRTCTNCHQVEDSYVGENNPRAWNEDGEFFRAGRIFYDTHFDNPDTKVIEGYNIDPTNERACRDCHNVHSGDLTIARQWAASGHAGEITTIKDAADKTDAANIFNAAVTNETGKPFVHETHPLTFSNEGRADCQHCHTATGSRNYLSDPANYDPADNDFSHLSGQQGEMVYCWACHSDSNGGLINPGQITSSLHKGLSFPDFADSNVCVNCHSGHVFDFVPAPYVVTHYKEAAAVLTAQNGYQYPGQDYSDVSFFHHDEIGLNVAADGSVSGSGPCAGCHMSGDESHSFDVFKKDETGMIIALNTDGCVECHTGAHSNPALVKEDWTDASGTLHTVEAGLAFLNAEAEGYHDALQLLEDVLRAAGIEYTGDFPYFEEDDWTDPDGDGTVQFSDAAMAAGAAINYTMLHHEPGAYAHNRFYAKRLIFDSVDYIVDGNLDGTITIDAITYPEAAHWFEADDDDLAHRPAEHD